MIINVDYHTLEFTCPHCGFFNSVTLKQIRLCDAIICRGCKDIIKFEDYMNETRKAIKLINKELWKLEEELKKIGSITIRL